MPSSTTTALLEELRSLGGERYKRTLMKNHGVTEPCFGVKIGDLKKIQKRIRKDYDLALQLYRTGNYDAQYLAGLIADDERMSPDDLQRWVESSAGGAIPGSIVPWVAAGSSHGWSMGLRWIDAREPKIAVAGWCTLASLVAVKSDGELDLPALRKLLARVQQELPLAPDAARYAMNDFLIAVGSYIEPLTEAALRVADRLGPVTADLGCNRCQIPSAALALREVLEKGAILKKRNSAKC